MRGAACHSRVLVPDKRNLAQALLSGSRYGMQTLHAATDTVTHKQRLEEGDDSSVVRECSAFIRSSFAEYDSVTAACESGPYIEDGTTIG
jgi:hypothetical protein